MKEKPMLMKALDLFCGAGGASMGLHQAGFEVTGVDLVYQKHFPWNKRLIVKDAMSVDVEFMCGFDLIWASPPCQKHSVMRRGRWQDREHPELIEPTRSLLKASGVHYVIENVVGAPLINPVMLCGSMFGLQTKHGSQLRLHRLFEATFPIEQPTCRHNEGSVIGVYGGGQHPGRRYHRDADGNLVTPHKQYPATIGVYGNSGGSSNRDGIQMFGTQDRRDAMGIQWMTGKELSQAIPPAYSKYIAEQFLMQLKGTKE